MFKLIATMKRGSGSDMPAAWARYPSIEAAHAGAADLFKEEKVLRVMVVRNEIPLAFVEWLDR